ncbi:MAG: nuclear transport factor 2 family protein [Ignavibacteria bacterium]|jgi:hypothetical protein
MPTYNLTSAQQEIWQVIQKINNAWSENRTEELHQYFYKDFVIVGTDLHPLAKGRDACIKSYKDFVSEAVVHEYKESDPVIDIFDDTAVAGYKFDITYEMKGKTYIEDGRDLFVFINGNGKWLAVWRMLLPEKK